jgi:hypothetical protein
MRDKIIIKADETIVCPHCAHEFALQDGITRQTIDRHASEFEDVLRTRRSEIEASVKAQALQDARQEAEAELARLKKQVELARKAEKDAQAAIEAARSEARQKALADWELQRAALASELEDKKNQLHTAQQQELELRKQKQEVEERGRNLELELQRKLAAERETIAKAAREHEAQRFALKEDEYRKKIEDAQKANDDLRRKLEQGSQQLQGEVLELHVEQSLTSSFFQDTIEEVKKGARGADVIQTVRTNSGVVAGKIIWEAKRAENWSDKWLQKLKEDQQEARADLAVLVTTAMPKGVTEPFALVGDVWVVSPNVLRPMAETLRVILLEAHKLRQANVGRTERVEQLFNYIASAPFAQRIRTVMDTVGTMSSELEQERRAMTRIWAKRQTQIDSLSTSMSVVLGDIQGILHDAVPGLQGIGTLEALALGGEGTK